MKDNLCYSITKRELHFKQPARTSRGVFRMRTSYYVTLSTFEASSIKGVGECATLPDLSCDTVPNYEEILHQACEAFITEGSIDYEHFRSYPSILFGLETALAQINAKGSCALFNTAFARGEQGIPINGLVWMGSFDEMYQQMKQKLQQGFRCIKLKVGAIDFKRELELVKYIRQHFTPQQVELRLDANGGFTPDEALSKLNAFSKYHIHSIEQPIKQHQWKDMARLCKESPIPIALDEELIGINQLKNKQDLLDFIHPQYIILKPSLHGGMQGTEEWIKLANERNIGSWMTSALESNIGLNAIAHLAAKVYAPHLTLPQGLGTGLLFTDNINMPLLLKGDEMWVNSTQTTKEIKL